MIRFDQVTRQNQPSEHERADERRRILVVEDEEPVRRLLRHVFESEGYAVSEARGQSELRRCLDTQDIALVTLDLTLKSEDGLAIARELRAVSDVPIVMVTAKTGDVDRIVGLELGADDYITKPFNVREVLARVRAVLRRSEPRARLAQVDRHAGFRFEGWELDLTEQQLKMADGAIRELTGAELKLLEAFVRRPNRVLSRGMLIDIVNGDSADPLERSIDTLVGRLRKKIEDSTQAPKLIRTVRGAGYIFAAKVTTF